MFLQNEGMGDFSSPAVLAHPLRVHRRSLLPRLALNAAEEKDLSHVLREPARAPDRHFRKVAPSPRLAPLVSNEEVPPKK